MVIRRASIFMHIPALSKSTFTLKNFSQRIQQTVVNYVCRMLIKLELVNACGSLTLEFVISHSADRTKILSTRWVHFRPYFFFSFASRNRIGWRVQKRSILSSFMNLHVTRTPIDCHQSSKQLSCIERWSK